MAQPSSLNERIMTSYKEDPDNAGESIQKVALTSGDIQLGAVEIKDASTDSRADVNDANTARTTATHVVATQHIDAGSVVGGVQGGVAHDAADSGNPIKIGGKASSAKPTAVAIGDRVNAYFDTFGRQHVYDEGGGGVSGGGLSTYVFTPSNSFGHGTSAYASGTTFTVSGHSFTPEAVALIKVDRFNSSGVFQESLSPAQNTITASTASGITTYTYSAGAFGAGDLFVVYQAGPERTVNIPNDAARNSQINRKGDNPLDDDLVDTTNVAAATHYYPSSTGLLLEGYRDYSISGKLIDADGTLTLTIQGMNDEDTTNGDWIQLYAYDDKNDIVANSWAVTNDTLTFAISLNNCNYKYIRIAVVANGATNTVIIKGRRKEI